MSAPHRLAMPGVSLIDLLRRAAASARVRAHPVLATFVEPLPAAAPDPLHAFERAEGVSDRVYWARPANGIAIAGIGAAATISPAGNDRFAAAARQWRALLDGALCDGPGAPEARPGHISNGRAPESLFGRLPMLLGGFRFDPARAPAPQWLGFPDCWLVVPRLCMTSSPAGAWLASSTLVHAGDDVELLARALDGDARAVMAMGGMDPRFRGDDTGDRFRGDDTGDRFRGDDTGNRFRGDDKNRRLRGDDGNHRSRGDERWDGDAAGRASFMRAVASGAAAVREGALEKVVTARAVEWRPDELPRIADTLRRLEQRHAECMVFAVARGSRTFLGASPERLVKLDGRMVRVTSLAGSTARGEDAEEDLRRATALLDSTKNREEHEIVVRTLTGELAELCDAVSAPAVPALLTLRDVHHLYTPITACRRDGVDVLRLVERLHPSPAVGGSPRRDALAFIRENERWERGWYASPVGWLDARGDGEFAVALRSALVDGDGGSATLFAGCGIVGDSVPEDEFAESELKLRAMREAFAGGEADAP